MKEKKPSKIGMIALATFVGLAFVVVAYWFQHKTVDIGGYTVVYYKNRCGVDPEGLSANLESLKTIPCLIRINWQEPIASDMLQEYCYLPGKGVEKTRLIHKKK
ncbi:MAG: hypothetical protein K4571_10370 [Deltaproteobacteria bacterium]